MKQQEQEYLKTKCRRLVGLANYPQKYAILLIEAEQLVHWLRSVIKDETTEE